MWERAMTPEQISLVQTSFARVRVIGPHLGAAFYDELFRIAPQVRVIFPDDMSAQHQKLVDALTYIVQNLRTPAMMERTLIGLAQRHVEYGAKPEHFAAVGMALMTALRQEVPGGMSQPEANAWLEAYSFVSDMMIAQFPAKSA